MISAQTQNTTANSSLMDNSSHVVSDKLINFLSKTLYKCKGLLLDENRSSWCRICSRPNNKQRCRRSPEEFAQIGLQIGIFKTDFTDSPFREDHPRLQQNRRLKAISNKNGTNVSQNKEAAKSASNANDASGDKMKIPANEKDSKSERYSKEEKDIKKSGAEIGKQIRHEDEKGIHLTSEQDENDSVLDEIQNSD